MRYKEFFSAKKQGVAEGSESELSQLNADIANVLKQPEFGGRAWLNGGSYSYMVDIKQPNKMKASDGSVITVKSWAHGLKDYASKWVLDAFLENYPEEWSGSLIYPVKSIQGQSDHEIRRLRGDIMEGSLSELAEKPSDGPGSDEYEELLFNLAYQYWRGDPDNWGAERKLSLLGWKADYGDDVVAVTLNKIGGGDRRHYDIEEFEAFGGDQSMAENRLNEFGGPGGPSTIKKAHVKVGDKVRGMLRDGRPYTGTAIKVWSRPSGKQNLELATINLETVNGEKITWDATLIAHTDDIDLIQQSVEEDNTHLNSNIKNNVQSKLNIELGKIKDLPVSVGIQQAQGKSFNVGSATGSGHKPAISIGDPKSGPYAQLTNKGVMLGYKKTFEASKKNKADDFLEAIGSSETELSIRPVKDSFIDLDEYLIIDKVENTKLLKEGPSISSTLRAIVNDIGEPVLQVYSTLKSAADKFVENKGELKGFNLIAGGIGNRWFQTFWFNKLQKELHHLVQQSPRNTEKLQQFLRTSPGNFSNISQQLPEILENIGKQLNNEALYSNARKWIATRNNYQNYLNKLESETTVDDEEDDRTSTDKSIKKTLGQQTNQAEQLVNAIINSLPNNIAGDVRNAIARSPNKLQALQAELQRRGIRPPVAEDAGVTTTANIASIPNPHISPGPARGKRSYIGSPGRSGTKSPPQPKPKKQKPTDNALNMRNTSIFGEPLRRK